MESWGLRGRHDAYRALDWVFFFLWGKLDFVQGTYPPLMRIEEDVLCDALASLAQSVPRVFFLCSKVNVCCAS